MNNKYITNSLKGLKRDKNQDDVYIVCNDIYELYVLFDGVSSLPNSHLFIKNFKLELDSLLKRHKFSLNQLTDIFFHCNKKVTNSRVEGMSTYTALYIDKGENLSFYSSIGDSRLYIYSNQFIEQISNDDSLEGSKNIITKCLGMDNLEVSDFNFYNVEFNSNFLICTDGFYDLMNDNLEEFFDSLNFKHLKNTKRKLESLSINKNNDDSTYIIIKK
ncbi:PP2C family serine/threonine-protein phosphatase [Marinifilum sp. D714]|uniref:PP2C family protein-serine/threonine phosphatase n=1 Tax=Marinifilum sp. D714 TaxID=2937523 RepID=UPI0027CDB7F0|nr:hypothetical protein [Marinifilum sp. D714]MDQ2180817.1 hypothetical protein [Marinifilum sp. D714]